MSAPRIDVVIPFHPKDEDILPYCLEGVRKNMVNLGTIYIVSAEKPDLDEGYIWIPESDYPFSLADVRSALPVPAASRAGWYLQQFLKLYAGRVLSASLSDDFCILDSECVFLNSIDYRDASGCLLLDHGGIRYDPYFSMIERLLPGQTCLDCGGLGVVDHMILNRSVLEDLLTRIEGRFGQPAWKAILSQVDPDQAPYSGFSEQELYYHFALQNYPALYRPRSTPFKRAFASSFSEMVSTEMDILTFHAWFRTK
jgi:hypothetical protein